MTEDHDDEETAAYEPSNPSPPEREPPRRSTAPQSDYNTSQVGFGLVVLAVGLAITFGLPLLL